MKLSKKIIIYFVSAILLSIFIVSLTSNLILNNSFDKYLVSEQESTLEQISEEINELYKENEYQLYDEQISSYASLENLTIKVKNLEDRIIYSSDQMHGMGNMNNRQYAFLKLLLETSEVQPYNQGRPFNRTIMMVLKDEQVPIAKECVTEVLGDLNQGNTGIFFTVPLDTWEGVRFE